MVSAQRPTVQPQTDLPLSVALVLLGVVVGGFMYLNSPTTFSFYMLLFDSYLKEHPNFSTGLALSVLVDCVWLYVALLRSFSINQQGRRLEILLGKKSAITKSDIFRGVGAVAVGLFGYLVLELLDLPGADVSPKFLNPSTVSAFLHLARVSSAFTLFTFVWAVRNISTDGFRKWVQRGRLPAYPKVPNGIVLGSTNEGEADKDPEWVTLSKNALYGNVLITGSIGGGKTQGTVLPYLDQILGNFSPTPALLLIDPKGTFIPRAIEMIEKHGHSENLCHLTLDGNITINPIFQERGLKGGRFLETAQMVKAAAANARTQTANSDSDFWEVSAFNFTKNALIYCYATRGYSTLEDLYRTMVEATEKNYGDELMEYLTKDEFDDEEKFNIGCAIQYFNSEYKQLDAKIRTSILATATSFLNQFQEYRANRIFCPKRENLTILSMDSIIDDGKFLLFDVRNPALARSMGTFIKLLYEQSVLNRMADPKRKGTRSTVLVVDEYQDVVTVGSGGTVGDTSFFAKSREADSITIVSTQSETSLENAIGREKATRELIQNFRTRLSGHSGDHRTIASFRELVGQKEQERTTRSLSENSQHPHRNILVGGFESPNANISESISIAEQKTDVVTGRDFSNLRTFECFGLIYDGVETTFKKLFLKPYFLKVKNTSHSKILEQMKLYAAAATACLAILLPASGYAFPNVCTVVKSSEFHSCLGLNIGACVCGWPIPRPCAQISYYVPQTFVEVMPNPKESYFSGFPGAAVQLGTVGSRVPFGAESDDDTHSFQAHTIAVPFADIPFSTLSCGGARIDQYCFDGMSEHFGSHWSTGSADLWQPSFLAWQLSPKACLVKGAVTSATGGGETVSSPGGHTCSFPVDYIPKFPPSQHSVCNGWGVFFPRSGVYNGTSQTAGALMVGSRIKSLSSEILRSTPSSPDEYWQMIYPQTSSCFREGQNVGVLETIKNAREVGRLSSGKFSGYLFVVWSKVSCCHDLAEVPTTLATIEAIKLSCEGIGSL